MQRAQVVAVALVVVLAAAVAWYARALATRRSHGERPASIEVFGDGCGPDRERRCEPYSVADELLGFRYRAGDFKVVVHARDAEVPHSFQSRSDAEGWRLTSADPARQAGKPGLWVFGCSFTWGYAVDWDAAFPARVQAARPDLDVRNFGGVGFGDVQAVLLLRDLLERRHLTPPRAAVFAYASFHGVRNVAAPSVLKTWGPSPGFRHPRAFFGPAGALEIELVPFEGFDRPDPPQALAVRVTQALFDDLAARSRAHGIVPVLAVQTFENPWGAEATMETEPVVAHARQAGFRIADLRVDHQSPALNNLPWDGHPNARAHADYARKLLDFLAAEGL